MRAMICVASSKQRSMRFARMWNSTSPGVDGAWRAPARISRNGCSFAGRGGPKRRSHASDPKLMTQERPPSRSRNSTARNNAERSLQNDRRAARLSRPGFSVATRKMAARVSGAATGCEVLDRSGFIWISVSGLISAIPPLVKQIELRFGPEWAAGRHGLTYQSILNRSCIRIVVGRIGHVPVIVQKHAVRLHVINIDFAKHRLDVL